jgi:hypothetical protein
MGCLVLDAEVARDTGGPGYIEWPLPCRVACPFSRPGYSTPHPRCRRAKTTYFPHQTSDTMTKDPD